jgi:hypothetical protein
MYEEIKEWCSRLAHEQEEEESSEDVIPRKSIIAVQSKSEGLSFIYGLQGIGKTASSAFLTGETGFRFKWREPGNFYNQMMQALAFYSTDEFVRYTLPKIRRFMQTSPSYEKTISNEKGMLFVYSSLRGEERVKKCSEEQATILLSRLPNSKRPAIEREIVLDFVLQNRNYENTVETPLDPNNNESFTIIVIDMPDYTRKTANQFSNDMQDVSNFWQQLMAGEWRGHLIVFVQKELIGRHLFQGKGAGYNLEPLTPVEMLALFKNKFEEQPFDDSALLLIAKLSRGIMRRYKKYIGLCVSNDPTRITEQVVNETITVGVLREDLETELSKIFRNTETLDIAVNLLSQLALSTIPPTQKQLSEVVSVGESSLGLILASLETNGYIARKQEGKEKHVLLK